MGNWPTPSQGKVHWDCHSGPEVGPTHLLGLLRRLNQNHHMNIIETAVTGLAFGSGTVVGVVAGMWATIVLGKKEREDTRKKQDDYNRETVRLLKIRASSSDLIAEALGEDTLHDKYVRAAVTGLCSNPSLVMGTTTRNPDGSGKLSVELGEEGITWAANRVADVVLRSRARAENETAETLAQALVRMGGEKQGIKHAEWWKGEPCSASDVGGDLTDTGEKK